MADPGDAQVGVPSGEPRARSVPVNETPEELEKIRSQLREFIINDSYAELEALLASRKDLLETPMDYELTENKETTTLHVTPLIFAVGRKRTRSVELLLKNDVNVKAEIPTKGGTALHIAARFGPAAIVALLLAKGADKDLQDKNLWAPLHFAAKYGHVQIASYLLDAHANLGVCDDSGSTPFLRAASFGYWKVMEVLFARGSKTQLEDRNKFSNPPVWVAALNNHLDTVKWLLDVGAPVDQLGESESTALHRACMSGHVDVAQLLIKRGADMHKKNQHSKTPLLLCCLNSQFGTYNLLQTEGIVVPSEIDQAGNNAFHSVLQCKKPFGNGQGEIMNKLLGLGVDINEANFLGLTPLMRSCKDRKVEHTKHLLDLHADINHRSLKTQSTPLLEACCNDNEELIELLLQRGADTTMTNRHGMNGLLFACLNKWIKNVRVLISHNVDVTARDNVRMSGFLIAARDGSAEIALELLKTQAYFPINPLQKMAFRDEFDHIREKVLKTLNSGFDKNLYESQESLQPVMNWAVVNGCSDLINMCIQKNPKALQWKRSGASWLHVATQHSQRKIMEECLAKIDASCEASGGRSALHIAVSNDDIETAKVLLNLIASQTPEKPWRGKAREIVKLNHDDESPLTFSISQRKKDLESLFWSELKSFGNIDQTFYQDHPAEAAKILDVLAEWEKPGNEVLLGHLLQQWFPRPANPALDATKWTTLHWAVYHSQAVVVWWLLSKRGYVRWNVLETARTIVPNTSVGNLILNLLHHPPPALDNVANPASQPPALPTEPTESEDALKRTASIVDVYSDGTKITIPHDTPSVRDLIYKRGPDSIIMAASQLDQCDLENFKREFKRAKASERGVSTPTGLQVPVSPTMDNDNHVKAWSDRTAGNLQLRWIHLPVNDLQLRRDLVTRLSHDSSHLEMDNQAIMRLFNRSWTELAAGGQKRYMKPQCLRDKIKLSTGRKDCMAIYMPYIKLGEYVQKLNQASSSPDASALGAAVNDAGAPGSFEESINSRNLRRIIHHPMTLDQYYYPTLSNTDQRDDDQVLSKYIETQQTKELQGKQTTKERPQTEAERTGKKKILTVDQLWIWIIDEKTIITSTTETSDKSDPSSLFQNALDNIRYGESKSRFERPTTVEAVMELILGVATGFFMQKCVKVTEGMRKAPTEVFRESIREVADEEIHTFRDFLNDLRAQTEKRQISREKSSGASSIRETPQNPYHIISDETELLDKIRDIRDELHMLRSLAEDQEVVWKQAFETSELRNCFQYNHPCTPTEVKRSLDDMNLEAETTHNSISTLLDLRQKQASLVEAEFGHLQANDTARQSNSVFVFTVITIIFLPLSFLSSLFALNITDFPHEGGILTYQGCWIFPILFGTTAIVSVPAIFFAWKVNLIRDWFRSQAPKEPTTISANAVLPPLQGRDPEGESRNQSSGTEGSILEKLPEAGLYEKLRRHYKKRTEELV
ncbi:uncharacterized protein N7483_002824 [Penicillium malachiteum]|uniref:uncharacterized protein n=1 Tax=Penicillium malachiteum TaxID=1324776 RepID=UPI002547FFC5|nr:uncharacterized protein N7483_002824 [Penicillium malachiteum]KAJ5737699.1 hypothetical protein N7483_002824 [Penicillium malachiteum]